MTQKGLDRILKENARRLIDDYDTYVKKIRLCYQDLSNLNFDGKDLRSFSFVGSNLTNTNFTDCNLKGCLFEKAIMTNAKGLPTQEEVLDKMFEKIEEGYIVYKTFGAYFDVPSYWKIKKGSIIEETVDKDRRNSCSWGINVATRDWIENNEACYDRSIWKCLLSFDDLDKVCVPYGTNGKIRCSRLKLLSKIRNKIKGDSYEKDYTERTDKNS